MYRNIIDFYIFILYPATLLNFSPVEILSLVGFLTGFLEFSIYKIMTFANRNSFSFEIWMPFSSFSCLSSWISLSSVEVDRSGPHNRSGENRHPYRVLDLGCEHG